MPLSSSKYDETIPATLHQTGFCVIHNVLNQGHLINERLNRARANFIEYSLTPGSAPFALHILANHGLLANPSSFHHPSLRYARLHCKRALEGELGKWILEQNMNRASRLECLYDYMCVRTNYPGEARWKRDVYNANQEGHRELLPGDLMLRGWVNCNPHEDTPTHPVQTLSLVPGSYTDQHNGPEVDEDMYEDYDARATVVEVPPGAMIIWRHGLAYRETKVTRSPKQTGPDIRLFLSFRLTLDTECLYEDQLVWAEKQAVPRIPSFQSKLEGSQPAMYSSRPRWVEVQQWALEMFRDECLTEVGAKEYKCPDRVMRSLSEYQLGMFPRYTAEELNTLKPTRLLLQ